MAPCYREFKKFYDEHYLHLWKWGIKVFGSVEMVETGLQEVFLKVHQKMEEDANWLLSLDNIQAYLYKMLRNNCLDQLKAKQKLELVGYDGHEKDLNKLQTSQEEDLPMAIILDEWSVKLHEIVDRLKGEGTLRNEEATVLEMRLANNSYQKIANAIEKTTGYVGNTLKRVKAKLIAIAASRNETV